MVLENALTRKVLTEKLPEEFRVIIVFAFPWNWYSDFIGATITVRLCISEDDMIGTNLSGYQGYFKVMKGNYKNCVICWNACFRVDTLDLVGIN